MVDFGRNVKILCDIRSISEGRTRYVKRVQVVDSQVIVPLQIVDDSIAIHVQLLKQRFGGLVRGTETDGLEAECEL